MALPGLCGGLTYKGCDDILIKDEGVEVGRATILNFLGTSVTATVTDGQADITISGGAGSGTVESVSVVSANGFSGSVSNPTTTPAITINVSALNAAKIADGSVSNTEFQRLDGVTSNIQSQFSSKQPNIQFQDEGVDIGVSGGISTINFTGAAVVASATGGVLTVRCSATGGGGSGTVESVSIVSANGFFGSVASATTTPKITIDVSGLSTSKIAGGAFGRAFIAIATTAAAVNVLGAGTVGASIFTAATTAAAQNTLGGGTFGKNFFSVSTTAAAQDALAFGAFGKLIITTGTTAAAQGMLNISSFGATLTVTADATAARNVLLTPGSVITGVSGAGAVGNMVTLTSGNYASITPVATTLYFITDAT